MFAAGSAFRRPSIDAPATMVVVAGSGTPGFADGTADAAQFNKPIRLAPSGPDAVVVSDIFNHAIRVVTKDGKVRTLAGVPRIEKAAWTATRRPPPSTLRTAWGRTPRAASRSQRPAATRFA